MPLLTSVQGSSKQLALHYNIPLVATRLAKPKNKGATKNEVKIVYQPIYAPLLNDVFHPVDRLNSAVTKQLVKHNEKHSGVKIIAGYNNS